ncbi:unnamed protein product [Symbiodinium natans]|uniref:ABC transmembrane type-1 domain-containing protein n=1 Tax=Symbiodinium natans TaxID=878477 RepID=A0A812QDJ7_9DINO|nr:unnamed protein product [Symbiodinium natans]
MRRIPGSCRLCTAAAPSVPFSVSTATKFKAFEWMGLVHKLPHCGLNQIEVLTDLLSRGQGVEHENNLAWQITLVWATLVLLVIVWSIYSVAIIPRKQPTDTVKMGLADDEKAYARGFINYVSLGWVDELVGRYGKNWNAVIDDNEIVCNRRDDAYAPYVKFRKHWEDEVERAGSVENAWILWALYKTVGFKASMAMVLLTFTEEIAGGVISIVGLQYFLNSLENLDAWANDHPGEELSYLGATVATLVWMWGSPMVFRFLSIIATLLDGHYTQICASGLASIVFHKALRTPASAARLESRETALLSARRCTVMGADGDEKPDPWGSNKPNLVQILNVDIVDCWGGLIRDCLCVFVAPFSITFLLGIMVSQISFSAVGGACYILPVMLLMMLSTQVAMGCWRRYQVFMDARLKWLTESLLSIRTIKALAWEKLAQEKLIKARDGELRCAKMMSVMRGVVSAVAHTLPWGVLVLTMWILLSKAGNGKVPAHEVMIVQRLIQANHQQGEETACDVMRQFKFVYRMMAIELPPWRSPWRSAAVLEKGLHQSTYEILQTVQTQQSLPVDKSEASTWMLDDVVKLLKKSRWEVTHNHSWKMPRPDSLPWNNQQGKTHQDTLTSCVSDVKLVSVKETTHFDKVMQDMKENHGHTTSHLNAVQSIVQPLSSRCPEDGRKGR